MNILEVAKSLNAFIPKQSSAHLEEGNIVFEDETHLQEFANIITEKETTKQIHLFYIGMIYREILAATPAERKKLKAKRKDATP